MRATPLLDAWADIGVSSDQQKELLSLKDTGIVDELVNLKAKQALSLASPIARSFPCQAAKSAVHTHERGAFGIRYSTRGLVGKF